MSIVSMVEKEFKIEISFDNIKKFDSVKSILAIIKKCLICKEFLKQLKMKKIISVL